MLDEFPVSVNMTAVEPLGLPVVVQTRPQVSCDPNLTLPVEEGKDSQLNVEIADVSREICVVPDEFPVFVATMAVQPLVLPVVVMMRPQAGCEPVLTLTVDEEKNSQVEDGSDMLSGRDLGYG